MPLSRSPCRVIAVWPPGAQATSSRSQTPRTPPQASKSDPMSLRTHGRFACRKQDLASGDRVADPPADGELQQPEPPSRRRSDGGGRSHLNVDRVPVHEGVPGRSGAVRVRRSRPLAGSDEPRRWPEDTYRESDPADKFLYAPPVSATRNQTPTYRTPRILRMNLVSTPAQRCCGAARRRQSPPSAEIRARELLPLQ